MTAITSFTFQATAAESREERVNFKAGKTRQFQFKMKPGEAMKQLVLDKTVDY